MTFSLAIHWSSASNNHVASRLARIVTPFLSATADKKRLALALDEFERAPRRNRQRATDAECGFYGRDERSGKR